VHSYRCPCPCTCCRSSSEAQRHCRCLASKQLSVHELDAIPEHGALECPKSPLVEANLTIASSNRKQRSLLRQRSLLGTTPEPDGDSVAAQLRELLTAFYAFKGFAYKDADVLITSLAPSLYTVRLAIKREDAVYLAYSVRVSLASFAQSTSGLELTDVAVGDGLRLGSGCGQFCEASGSFLGGILPTRAPPPTPPMSPPIEEPCLNPCLQTNCGDVVGFGTCSQLLLNDCACDGCCVPDDASPPSPPSPPPPPPTPCPRLDAACILTTEQAALRCMCNRQ
jgi:hypothetical protein